ncbi:Pkinase-domain-containing protein [Epithele typhae]|uniref:Pkinase-domain-containing protein n=1 Tax=Epithele typhae TaxID=378194 RepID=UPI002008E169|nr:Pkinase-domain-containing protein [Epithele typhae]KAH9940903.1 Pkinase-domain-containing protein [Epithele typhae]
MPTKSKAKAPVSVDETGLLSQSTVKGKGRASEDDGPKEKDKAKSRMLSKVPFRRTDGAAGRGAKDRDRDKVRVAGHTSFLTPSLRQASMSSPTLHLSAQPILSSFTQPFALPSGSTSNVAALVSPPRDRSRRASVQPVVSPRDISGPTPLAPRRVGASSPHRDSERTPKRPPPLTLAPAPTVPSTPNTPRSPPPETPTRRSRDAARTPDPGSPSPRGLGMSQRRAAASASHLPLGYGAPPAPIQPRSPSRTSISHRPIPSASSSSHLPLTSTPTGNSGRRPSLDARRQGTVPHHPRPIPARPHLPPLPAPARFSPSFNHTRLYNASSTSLATPANPEHRELIRSATSFLCKEMLKPPSSAHKNSLDPKDWEEVEARLRALARLERIWNRTGAMASTSQVNMAGLNGALASGGEEKERRLFAEALRDGYVLCQCVNKLFPGTIHRVDKREDGFVRTSNVTKFLAGSSSVGLASDELFHRDDLIEANSECLARVARSILALSRLAEFPGADKSKILLGGGGSRPGNSPYGQNGRAAASTPNLNMSPLQRSVSPSGPTSPTSRKRWSPHHHLPTVRSDSPNEDVSDGRTANDDDVFGGPPNRKAAKAGDQDEAPPAVPPRSPLRVRPVAERVSIADSTRASMGDSVVGPLVDTLDLPPPMRQSQASSNLTDSTVYSTAFSSLLDPHPPRSPSSQTRFGTIRTINTDATSFALSDSLSRADGSSIAPSLKDDGLRRSIDSPSRPSRERRPSETAVVDLTRVVEETEDSATSKSRSDKSEGDKSRTPSSRQPIPIKLGKGKWPDDFIGLDSFQTPKSSLWDDDESLNASVHTPYTPLSVSPPRSKLAPPARQPNESVESLPQFQRRPTHRARHSVDAAGGGLLPKESILRRDSSPDASGSPPRRIILRRSSSKAPSNRNGIYIPRQEGSVSPEGSDSPVPFPRTVSGEHSAPTGALVFPTSSSPDDARDLDPASPSSAPDRPRLPRGRFQSEVDAASARRKPRPNSFDEYGAKPPRRSRFESMVNLGVASSSNASASDLMSRDSYDGSAVRQTLIVREDGKAPTQFQLGNCIGRGQFGAVYRALNLNTGQMVAVKRIRLEGLKEEEIAQLMKEVDLVKSLSHPSIVKYEGMARDDDSLSIVLEYAENGSLGQTLKAFGKLNERLVANYVVKILEGLHYLHQNDVVHCDLKAANILTTKTGNVKLSDFGVSLNLRAMEREMKDVAGTPNWMAPEVIELKGASTKADIWSLACTVIELLTGRPPYADIANSMSVMFRIVEDECPPLPEECSESLQEFLKWCFNKDPTKRPSAEQLFEHEWLMSHSAAHKHLQVFRRQDSIPFLRRVSADMQKSKVIRYLADIEKQVSDPAPADRRTSFELPSPSVQSTPGRPRMSNSGESFSPREHSFVKTTFGKPVICRVCLQNVKKSAVLCEQCSLICHSRCSNNAPPTCDLRAQLLLYAQYAEAGNPNNPYSPMEILTAAVQAPTSPTSQTSDDGAGGAGNSLHPPTSFRVLTAFKRSKSSLPADQENGSTSQLPTPTKQLSRKSSVLHRKGKASDPTADRLARPPSISSNSTNPNSSSVRSAVTATESIASSQQRPRVSGGDKSDRLSRMTSFSAVSALSGAETERDSVVDPMPGGANKRRQRESGGCTVQ